MTPPPTVTRRRRFGPRSLTAKLVVGVVALVLVVVVAAGVGTYFALRAFLYGRLDQQLAAVANGNVEQIDRCPSLANCPPVQGSGRIDSPQVEYFAILDANGATAALPPESRAVQVMLLSQSAGAAILSGQSTRTVTTSDGVELRVTARALEPPLNGYYLVTGLSTDEVDRTLRRLVELDLFIGGVGTLVALVATLYGVRFSLRRLYQVTATARGVAAELSPEGAGLERRVEVHDADTEVGQLADSMNTLLAAVETQFAARLASEQRMRQFLADASHELRTPLTSIRGYAELARMQQAQQGATTSGDDPDNLQRIEWEGTRMSKLVDDLLLLARGDQGAEREYGSVELIDIADIVDEAEARVHAAYPGRPLTTDVGQDVMVIGDPDQLLRVLTNLMTNAAVHTEPGGPIEVRAVREGDTVVLTVRDHGPGLPPEEAAQVFDRFWRADKARSRARGGSGLGLSIVASLVAAHRGTVQFASTVEGGSTVTVRLPAATGTDSP